jgi:hypothetical protein
VVVAVDQRVAVADHGRSTEMVALWAIATSNGPAGDRL